jgi:hypothetical protein
MVSRDYRLSLRKQCELLRLSRSRLYYQPVGESAENLRFMEIIRCPAGDLRTQICREGQAVSGNTVVWIAPNGQVHEAEWASM